MASVSHADAITPTRGSSNTLPPKFRISATAFCMNSVLVLFVATMSVPRKLLITLPGQLARAPGAAPHYRRSRIRARP